MHEHGHRRRADGQHQRVAQGGQELLVAQHRPPIVERPRVGDVEEAEELHERAEEREEHGHAQDDQHQRRHGGGGGCAPAAEPVRLVLELARDGRVAAPPRQPLLPEDERQHGGQDQDGQRRGRVVARHPRDEQVVDHRAEHEEAEGHA